MSKSYSEESKSGENTQVVELPDGLGGLLSRRESRFRPLFPVEGVVDPRAAVANGFTFRFAWPNRTKGGIFTLNNFFGIKPDWNVFVSAGEARVLGDATAGSFVGNARFTVTGVAPDNNVMVIGVAIEDFNGAWPWPGGPLAMITDYLVVPF
jgi:hypothetical protein